MTPERIIFAALVAKLGGEVTLSKKDIDDAYDLELIEWEDPASFRLRYTAKPAPIVLEGELANEIDPRSGE